jgi:hypothetical protein
MLRQAEPSAFARLTGGADSRNSMLAEVDFKWLMAGEGWWIDAPRFENDPAYAAGLLRLAMESSSFALRESAAALKAQRDEAARQPRLNLIPASGTRSH